MKKDFQLPFHRDPGHGWVEVSRSDLASLKIAHKISGYSYQKGNSVFLEEDCDAGIFIKAARDAGHSVSTKDISYNSDAPLRRYAPYSAGKSA